MLHRNIIAAFSFPVTGQEQAQSQPRESGHSAACGAGIVSPLRVASQFWKRSKYR